MLQESPDLRAIWWCQGGCDGATKRTRTAWSFLEPYASHGK
jgi:hypothetical protein